VRYTRALIVAFLAVGGLSARADAELADVTRFCAAMAGANSAALDWAQARIEAIKREIAALVTLRAKRDRVAADTAAARAQVANQRRDIEALRMQVAHLSPAMIEERRLASADLMARLEVLDRYRQTEGVLEIELGGIDAEIAARRAHADSPALATVATSESELRRCLADRRERLR
jgi:hypothetical protein